MIKDDIASDNYKKKIKYVWEVTKQNLEPVWDSRYLDDHKNMFF